MHNQRRSTVNPASLLTAITCALTAWGCADNGNPTEPASDFLPPAGPNDTFVPIDYPGSTFTSPTGINSAGSIVGQYIDGANQRHGFVRYRNGAYASIDYPGAASTQAWGINASGDIVGSYSEGSRNHGFLVSRGSFSSFDFPGPTGPAPSTFASSINPSGDIVGEYKLVDHVPGVPGDAFLYQKGAFLHISPPNAKAAVAWAINASGQSVGYYTDQQVPSVTHGWLRDPAGAYTVIDYPGATFTNARGISPAGVIVGLYRVASGTTRGFVLDQGNFSSIEYPGAAFTRLLGISARGDIVGDYRDASNKMRGFLLTRGPGF